MKRKKMMKQKNPARTKENYFSQEKEQNIQQSISAKKWISFFLILIICIAILTLSLQCNGLFFRELLMGISIFGLLGIMNFLEGQAPHRG